MDENTPQVDKDEQADRNNTVEGEDEGENVVWQGLGVAIKWVESVTGVWSGDEPFVVWLVNVFVEPWVVCESVDPVDEKIGEKEEEWDGEQGVCPTVI